MVQEKVLATLASSHHSGPFAAALVYNYGFDCDAWVAPIVAAVPF